jgi:hypothetical protein
VGPFFFDERGGWGKSSFNRVEQRCHSVGFGKHRVDSNSRRQIASYVVAVHREENDANFGNRHFQHRRRFRAVHLGHGKIEKDQIRLECFCFLYGLESVGGFAANGNVGASCENVLDSLPNEIAVVGYQQLLWHKQTAYFGYVRPGIQCSM